MTICIPQQVCDKSSSICYPSESYSHPGYLSSSSLRILYSAVKFTQEGEIVVTAFSEPVSNTTNGEEMSRVTISVQDTGIGIAKENFNKLFR